MKKFFLVSLVLVVFFHRGHAQYIFQQGKLPNSVSLLDFSTLSDVGFHEYTPAFVREHYSRLGFRPMHGEYGNLGFTNHTFWVRVECINHSAEPVHYYLETAEAMTDIVNLYLSNPDGSFEEQKNGDHQAFQLRSVANRKPVFTLNLGVNERRTAWIEVKNDGERNSMPVRLLSQQQFQENTYTDQLILGLFYGILLIIIISYIFFYLALREPSFFYYLFYVLTIGLCQFSLDGLTHQYLDQGTSWLSLHAVILTAILSCYFFGRYTELILDIPVSAPGVHRLFLCLYRILEIVFGATVLIPAFLRYCYPIVNVLTLAGILLIVFAMLFLVIRRKPLDGIYTVGISLLFSSFLYIILVNFGLVAHRLSIDVYIKMGIGLEIMALSLSTANRFRVLKIHQIVLERTALQKAQQMNEVKTYFLSNMSHELRTPLNAIMGLTGIMGKETNDQTLLSRYEIIQSASQKLLSSVNDMLDFSNIEQGQLVLDEVEFSPSRVFEKLRKTYQSQAQEKGLDFTYTSDLTPTVSLRGDPGRLEQMVGNVLNNAIKFTPTGIVQFHVSACNFPAHRLGLTLRVIDTGIGIAKDKQATIFELFSQANLHHNRSFGGFGIGLCVAKSLVDLNGGQLVLTSQAGMGTECIIELNYPLLAIESPRIASESSNGIAHEAVAGVAASGNTQTPTGSGSSTGTGHPLQGIKILVVEDNPMNQMVVRLILRKWTDTLVYFASNGLEGLEMLRSHPIDMVLMDLHMPVMDGFEAISAIRNGQAGALHAAVPILVLTADATDVARERSRALGANGWMTKPVNQEELYEKVCFHLAHTPPMPVIAGQLIPF